MTNEAQIKPRVSLLGLLFRNRNERPMGSLRQPEMPVLQTAGDRRCKRCDVCKPIVEFGVFGRDRVSRRWVCKACMQTRQKELDSRPQARAKQAEARARPEIKARQRAYEADPINKARKVEKAKAAHRKAARDEYASRPETKALKRANSAAEHRKASIARFEASPERIAYKLAYARSDAAKASSDRYRRANLEKYVAYQNNRRARKIKAGGVLSPGLKGKLFTLQRGRCACCGQKLGRDYHMDHIVPLAKGGPNEDSNIQLLRRQCNLVKKVKDPIHYMQEKGFLL